MAKVLSGKQIEAAWQAYCEEQSGQAIKRKVGLHPETASKLINRGYDKPYTPPFKERYAEIVEMARALADKRALADTATQLVGLRAQLAELRGINSLALQKAKEALEDPSCEVDPIKALAALTKSIKASVELEAMLALIDSPEDMDAAAEDIAEDVTKWSEGELERYAETGEWPPGRPRPSYMERGSVH